METVIVPAWREPLETPPQRSPESAPAQEYPPAAPPAVTAETDAAQIPDTPTPAASGQSGRPAWHSNVDYTY